MIMMMIMNLEPGTLTTVCRNSIHETRARGPTVPHDNCWSSCHVAGLGHGAQRPRSYLTRPIFLLIRSGCLHLLGCSSGLRLSCIKLSSLVGGNGTTRTAPPFQKSAFSIASPSTAAVAWACSFRSIVKAFRSVSRPMSAELPL